MQPNVKFQVAEEIYLDKNNECTVPMFEKLFEITENDDLSCLTEKLKFHYNDFNLTLVEDENRSGFAFICTSNNEDHIIRVIETDLYENFVSHCY